MQSLEAKAIGCDFPIFPTLLPIVPVSEAFVYNINSLVSGNIKTGELVNLSFNVSNACCCSLPHANSAPNSTKLC